MNTPPGRNPYQPPQADVTPQIDPSEYELIEGGQAVPPGNAMSWIGGGWTLFTKSPGIWIANMIILFVLSITVSFIPLIGSLASNLLTPVIIAGLLLGCRSLDEGGELRVDHLFAGFKQNTGQLILVGLLMLVAIFAIIIVAVIVIVAMFGAAMLQSFGDQQALTQFMMESGWTMLALFVLLVLALIVPVMMAYWFAPALVVFHNLDAINAMKQSFSGCLRNIGPFLLYGIVFFFLFIVAVLPLFLGLLIVFPMVYGSLYASYKDIFIKQS
jgi:uncharacterized membrane protein